MQPAVRQAARPKEDPGVSPRNHSNGACLERKGLCAQAVWGRRPKITKNLKLQGEVEGGVVASNGELLLEGKEKSVWEGC